MISGFGGSYCGPASDAATWLARWNPDPALLACLVLAAALAWRLPRGRRDAGLATAAVAAVVFVSPLCALSVALFAGRAVHHLLLVAVAAPLAAIAWPPRRAPGVAPALAIASGVLWAWHLPLLYDAALENMALYWLMQASLLGSAWAYWAAIRAASPAGALAGIAAGAGQMGLLGAILTFAPRPLYAAHLLTTAGFGLGPLADQQFAGLVMWVPGLIPYAIAGGLLASRRWRAMAGA
ncbi:MAG: cytochrome c oxidase assembly protein [Sphingomonas sp.]